MRVFACLLQRPCKPQPWSTWVGHGLDLQLESMHLPLAVTVRGVFFALQEPVAANSLATLWYVLAMLLLSLLMILTLAQLPRVKQSNGDVYFLFMARYSLAKLRH